MTEDLVACVALLRAVNVGGRNRMPMSELTDAAAEFGLVQPQTLLQSGNLVFGAPANALTALPGRLSAAIRRRTGVDTPVILRTLDALAVTAAANPFAEAAAADPGRLHIAFLTASPRAEDVDRLGRLATGGEAVAARGCELFIHYAAGAGASRLTQSIVDKRLGVVGTARNWNTVTALLAMGHALLARF